MNDRPIHLKDYSYVCSSGSYHEASVNVPVRITQSNLDGLHSLIKFLEGFEAAGKGSVPGRHELVMFYRTIQGAIVEANNANLPLKSPGVDIIVKD